MANAKESNSGKRKTMQGIELHVGENSIKLHIVTADGSLYEILDVPKDCEINWNVEFGRGDGNNINDFIIKEGEGREET